MDERRHDEQRADGHTDGNGAQGPGGPQAARERQTLELAYWCGLSQREISEAMAVPVGTVKGRARLGLQKLRDALEGREETWQLR